MSRRFFVDSPIEGEQVTLEDAEAHHLLHVLRGKPGDEIVLFDDSGAEFQCEIASIARKSAVLRVVERFEIDRELPQSLSLAVSLPKGDRQKMLIEKVVELGVTRLIPLQTERGVAQPTDSAILRLKKSVIQASKQCGRNRLMEIARSISWFDLVQQDQGAQAKLIAAPRTNVSWSLGGGQPCIVAIGPEGGFSEKEEAAAEANQWAPLNLGNRILRIETAAFATAAVIGEKMSGR